MALGSSQQNDKLVARLAAFFVVFVAIADGGYVHAVEFQGQVLDYQANQIYHSPQTPGYTAWAGVWNLPNGTIQTDFVQATGPTSSPTITSPVLQSTDNGQTWTRVPGDVPTGWSRGMAVLPDGTMVRPDMTGIYLDATGHFQYPNHNFVGVQYSNDGGLTWSQSINLVSPTDYQVCLPVVIKPLSDGRLVAVGGICASNVASNLVMANIVKTMFISSDEGKTWGVPITLMPASTGVCEESDFVELPGGNLMAISRAQHYDANGNFLSENRLETMVGKVGDTFVPAITSTSPFPGSGMPCELMTKEGVILDLESNSVDHWSADDGQTWHTLLVGGQPLSSFDYPQAVQAADGTIVIVGHVGSDDAYGTVNQAIVCQTFRLSAEPLPEPSTLTLLGIGVLGFLAYAWRRCGRAV